MKACSYSALSFALACVLASCMAQGREPDPRGISRLRLHGATDASAFAAVIADFEHLYGCQVDYVQMTSEELYERARRPGSGERPDLLISPAMDLQSKLVNDGYALPHHSEQTAAVPAWARWRDEAFGITAEPAVLVYNPRLLPDARAPRTRAQLLALLRDPTRPLHGRVGSYDVRRSGLGYLLATQDARLSPLSSALSAALSDNDVVLEAETRLLLQGVSAGRLALAYNVLGSYAQARIAAGDPLDVVQLQDYTLVVARVALIPKSAPHAAQARELLDYLLSERGQRTLERSGLPAIRHGAAKAAAGGALRSVPLGPGLLVYRDASKRRAFLEAWTNAVVR